MGSSVESTLYLCIAQGGRIIFSYNTKDRELETLAALCLENSPQFHKWYFHTVSTRTFGYLMSDGCTYFAIVDPTLGKSALLQFLKQIREEFRNSRASGAFDSLTPIIRRLIASMDNMPRSAILAEENFHGVGISDASPSSMAPLLPKGDGIGDSEIDEDHTHSGLKISMPIEEVGALSLERTSSSSTRARRQYSGRSLWWRHVRIVVLADVALCLVLFGIWLGVCRGFRRRWVPRRCPRNAARERTLRIDFMKWIFHLKMRLTYRLGSWNLKNASNLIRVLY
ncbi:putative VAMP-like protein [Ananas comosus]|uniref:Putative VAMP-like protein n=1 Tax=Ananas comosus TaxID=4615 RepID=A0A199VFP9_ANACO|nr:putative VAMP-like protein [Ananas comosus]